MTVLESLFADMGSWTQAKSGYCYGELKWLFYIVGPVEFTSTLIIELASSNCQTIQGCEPSYATKKKTIHNNKQNQNNFNNNTTTLNYI